MVAWAASLRLGPLASPRFLARVLAGHPPRTATAVQAVAALVLALALRRHRPGLQSLAASLPAGRPAP